MAGNRQRKTAKIAFHYFYKKVFSVCYSFLIHFALLDELQNQSLQALTLFPKSLIVCVSGGKKCSFFIKFGVLCFFCNTDFEIRDFALLPTKYFGNSLKLVKFEW